MLGWTGLIAVSLGLTFGMSVMLANVVGERPSRLPTPEASYLARHGKRCLARVSDPDIAPNPAFSPWWQRLGEEDCRPGSWLSQFREFGQTFAQYQAEGPNRPELDAPLQLTALGDFRVRGVQARDLLEPVREFIEIYYQRSTQLTAPRDLPASAWHPERGATGQYDAEEVLESLQGSCPTGSGGCLSATDEDLFVNTLQYVFGLGHFHRRVGVFSMYRLWEPISDGSPTGRRAVVDPEPLRRALKVAVHEMGHEFTVAHCVHYRRCVMAGTNSLTESDAGSLMLCPLDHAKLRWNLRFDDRKRFRELADFAARHGLHAEARYWTDMSEAQPQLPNAAGGRQ